MTETPDYSGIERFPDGRTPTEYDRDYRKILGDVQNGEPPTIDELATAPLITRWEIKPLLDRETERQLGYPPMQIWGYFEGHPFLPAEEYAHTSPVLQVDPEWQWARCASRVYRLGGRIK